MTPGRSAAGRHANYEVLNLIGYGLAKFDRELVAALGFRTKAEWYAQPIERGVAETAGTLKNRQDLFNPLVRGTKVGWWQNRDRYLHRKTLLGSLFGQLAVGRYAEVVATYPRTHFPLAGERAPAPAPLMPSMFRLLQETGREAELFFMASYQSVPELADGRLDDARLFGDGYDFQITLPGRHVLAEVKGVRDHEGGIRLTKKEHQRAGSSGATTALPWSVAWPRRPGWPSSSTRSPC